MSDRDPLNDFFHGIVLEIGRDNPTVDLRFFRQSPGEELRGFDGFTPDEIADAVADEKFPNLFHDFDLNQPRVYKGVWL